MMGRSHAALGALFGALAAHTAGADVVEVVLLTPVGMLGGLAPDLDHPNSKLGRWLPRWWHRLTPGHRGISHSLLWAFAVGLAVTVAVVLTTGGIRAGLLVGLVTLVGILSHLAADGITTQGVPWLYPWRRVRYTLPREVAIRTGGLAERVIVGVVVTVGSLLLTGGAL